MIGGSSNANMIDVCRLKISYFLIPVFTIAGLSSSCEKKADRITSSDIMNLPSQTVRDGSTIYSDSGKIQIVMSAPLMESYDNTDEPYSIFRKGIDLVYYDGKKDSVGRISAKYARYTAKKNLWELKDSVIVSNFESNYKIETEELFWDQQKDILYNDRFLKITSEDEIVYGTGFESDSRLNKRKIKNVSGPIYLHDE